MKFNCAKQGSKSWLDRADKCVELLETIESDAYPPLSLCDIGCGDLKLKSKLEESGLEFTYVGLDIEPQNSQVLKFDIESDSISDSYDVVSLLGVTEYLSSLSGVLERLGKSSRYIIFSHVLVESNNYSDTDLDRLGWSLHLSEIEVLQEIATAGLVVSKSKITKNKKTMVWLCRAAD